MQLPVIETPPFVPAGLRPGSPPWTGAQPQAVFAATLAVAPRASEDAPAGAVDWIPARGIFGLALLGFALVWLSRRGGARRRREPPQS